MVDHPRGFNAKKAQNHSTIINRVKKRRRIKKLLGDNFVGVRQCGDKVEILTKGEIPPGILVAVQKVWRDE